MPILSIVIANYNYGRFLEDAIKSILSQQGFDLCELIVVDGGSTDNSCDVIHKYADNIAWWCSEPDGGQSEAFNKGFSHASGKFLTWLNADDVLTSGALMAVITQIKRHPSCEWFVGSSLWADSDLRIQRCFCAHRFSVLRAKIGMISAAGPSSFFARRLFDAAGGIDESLHYVMDTDLWMRFFLKEGVRYRRIIRNVWAYRRHEASKMSGADEHNTQRAQENRRKAAREEELLQTRYHRLGGWRVWLVRILTISIVDMIIARVRTLRLKGKYATEI